MDGSPLTVTLYTNLLGSAMRAGLPEHRNKYVWHFWENMIRFYPNIKLKYEYYYDAHDGDTAFVKYFNVKTLDEAAQKMAEFFGGEVFAFPKTVGDKKEDLFERRKLRAHHAVGIQRQERISQNLSDLKVWPDENHISGTIRRLTRDSVPLIVFTTGHYERSPYKSGEREFDKHTAGIGSRGALINKGVDIDTVDLRQQNIPDRTDILVVADPRAALDTAEQHKLLSWLDKGGDAVFYAETGKQQMLNPILQTLR